MQELLKLTTTDFELVVRANDISPRLKVYQSTLASKAGLGTDVPEPSYLLQVSPAMEFDSVSVFGTDNAQPAPRNKHCEFQLSQPLFFENTKYKFIWRFSKKASKIAVTHPNQNICESFDLITREDSSEPIFEGWINTGNDVGWLRIPLSYSLGDKTYKLQLAFEVLPTKMLLHQDLPAMYQAIDSAYPLWRFSLAKKTEQSVGTGGERGHFPLMWLAHFAALKERFEEGLKVITAAPHSRLQPSVTQLKAARLKGKISHKLAQKVKTDLTNGLYDKHYKVEKKRLSVDTPENRFIKMVVQQSKQQLAKFEAQLRANNEALEQQRLSEAFLDELRSWQQPLKKALNQSFLKEVGDFAGMSRESLVLQQKAGYSTVYRVWQELKFYLNLFGGQANISMKSVAEIYEVWCFLCLKQILEQELEFVLVQDNKIKLTPKSFYEYQLIDGQVGAFHFERSDGVTAVLEHEYLFTAKGQLFRTYLVTQKPDIVLKVTIPPQSNGGKEKQFIWLFDAKYRVEDILTDLDNQFAGKPYDASLNDNLKDGVPDDAINQMHRYRDALIRLSEQQDSAKPSKSRPVFGAFALYPGFYDQAVLNNPYASAIAEIGIGAFALLPSQNNETNAGCGHKWLLDFLQEQIGLPTSTANYPTSMAERLYVQEAARIPYHGMRQILYPDLTLTIALGDKEGREPIYFEKFEQGIAQWYHIPQRTFLQKFKQHIIAEIRYLALASHLNQNASIKQINKLWPVKNAKLLPRSAISKEMSGKESSSTELFYLFELGKPLTLQDPITDVPPNTTRGSMKLTTLTKLKNVEKFSEIESVYEEFLANELKQSV